MSKDIFIYIEHDNKTIKDVSLELINKAMELSLSRPTFHSNIVAVMLGDKQTDLEKDPIYYGADKVITYYHENLQTYNTRNYALVITEIIKEFKPLAFLFGGTNTGRDLAPRVSARAQTGLTADATSIEFNIEDSSSKTLWITRPAFGGNLYATIVCEDHLPQMATIRPGIFMKQGRVVTKECNIISFEKELSFRKGITINKKIIKESSSHKDITKANIIVSAGRGVKNNIPLLQEASVSLKGELAASRAIVDEGFVNKSIQVGQTGKTVRPTIYLACGISGAVQHTAGMSNSELVIAINTDEQATIFDIADVSIVGDAVPILKKLIEKLK
jgi:electron transfer flavoprotein alpha subunit